MTLRCSAVVPTCRRPDLLERCLEALLGQRFCPSAYEVLVVDDAASAETRRQVERLAERARASGYTIRYLAVTGRHGPAAARNLGWQAARAGIVAFTDDDCLPDPGWLAAGTGVFADGVAGVSGRLIMPIPPVPTDYERNASQLEHAEYVTANCFYRRAAVAAVGGFDERFSAAWREDSDLSFTLLERNAKLAFAPDSIVVHPVRPAHWGVSLSQQRKSFFNALLYKKHPALYRKRIQAGPPWPYYRIVGALLATLVAAALGLAIVALAFAAIWLALTARFCALRLRHTSHAPRHIAEMIVTSLIIPPLAVYWRLRGACRFHVLFL